MTLNRECYQPTRPAPSHTQAPFPALAPSHTQRGPGTLTTLPAAAPIPKAGALRIEDITSSGKVMGTSTHLIRLGRVSVKLQVHAGSGRGEEPPCARSDPRLHRHHLASEAAATVPSISQRMKLRHAWCKGLLKAGQEVGPGLEPSPPHQVTGGCFSLDLSFLSCRMGIIAVPL